MSQPTPAIVAQGAVRRLPRAALLLFCLAYLLPGFIGREPWKSADMTAFGYMLELVHGSSDWFAPTLMGVAPEVDALLPYWLGAWAMQLAPALMAPDLAARIPFIALLALAMLATWYGTYYLARSPGAQPLPFAFGGEAQAPDYARAIADGALLALIACLGLAQLAHETTPALAQLCFTALIFHALAAMPYRTVAPLLGGTLGLAGLALSGAPTLALLFGLGGALIAWRDRPDPDENAPRKPRRAWAVLLASALMALLAWKLDLWRWRITFAQASWSEWQSLGRLLLWFTWPAWPLALWTLWRWRRQLRRGEFSRHLALPMWFALVSIATTLSTASAERSLLLGLPALAALAAFALPTLKRSVAALVDWFTLLFFSGCALVIWVVWIAMQTGVPHQPAANVARLAPGFEPAFGWVAFVLALAATLAWAWLVQWRVGRNRAAIWKSLVLPAGGAALCWLLLMTLWLPLLDFARSYAPLVRRVAGTLDEPHCVETRGLSRGQIAAFEFHARLNLRPAGTTEKCPWLVVDRDAVGTMVGSFNLDQWKLHSTIRRPSDSNEDIMLFRRRD